MMANSCMTNLVQRCNPNQTQESGPSTIGKITHSTISQDTSTRPRPHSNITNFGRDHFGQRITQKQTVVPSAMRRYPPNLTPTPSPLCPTCPAKDRLLLWKLTEHTHRSNNTNPPLPPTNKECIREVLTEAYSNSTKAMYGTGILVFHVFCDRKGINKTQRAPCEQTPLSNFISTLIGNYLAQAIKNYTYSLQAWHIIHRIPWNVNNAELQTLFTSTAKNQPLKSTKAQRPPCTIEDLVAIHKNLNPRDPFDTTVLACRTTTFWLVAQLGELTIPKLNAFNPKIHVKYSNLNQNVMDRHGNKVTTIFIPWTKALKSQGEELNWAAQALTGADLEEAMRNHLNINQFDNNSHLFQHHWKGTSRPMSKSIFLTQIRKALMAAKRKPIAGHSLRIGGTLEYLLRGIDFPVV